MDSTSTPASIPSVDEFLTKRNSSIAAASSKSLENELELRKLMKPFPLHIFNPKIKPFIEALHREYDLPRAYIGLGMLAAYSSAVGSAYHIKLKKIGDIYFPIWACLEGRSSAGKSLVMNQIFKPLYDIQDELEDQWFEDIEGKTDDYIMKMKSKQLIYGEAHIPTLIKDVMPHNPKGILQDADEILSWINGMNQLAGKGKEGTDEQFWMKSWNCKPHRKRLAGNKVFVIRRPYLNVFGGAQPSVMHKLFKNDRATTGFIFRILFAVPEVHKIADPNLNYDMPEDWEQLHKKCLNSLYKGLPVDDDTESREMTLDTRAMKTFNEWASAKMRAANNEKDEYMGEMMSGIYGKIKEYALRFAGLLHIADKAYNGEKFDVRELINSDTMSRALEAADYFFESAKNLSERVNSQVIASLDVIRFSSYVKAGFTMQRIGDLEYKDVKKEDARRIKATRQVKKYLQEFPKVFGAEGK